MPAFWKARLEVSINSCGMPSVLVAHETTRQILPQVFSFVNIANCSLHQMPSIINLWFGVYPQQRALPFTYMVDPFGILGKGLRLRCRVGPSFEVFGSICDFQYSRFDWAQSTILHSPSSFRIISSNMGKTMKLQTQMRLLFYNGKLCKC